MLNLQCLSNKDCKKSLTIISYIFVFNLIPFLLKNNDEDVAFHAKQGFIQMFIWLLIPYVLLVPLLGWILGALLIVANIAVMLTGIYNASISRKAYVPLVGRFFEKVL